ncbi:outer membrane beta-barrel protein [Dyadobacter sp. CY356]|uniref:outer membrane beta-barrel protein n=1 Tax=Dyadobacter sp. CY356 TaxID=2906442 RepID=UPI001F354AD7|nr:outer membrane beta-barrel protein [Dyadobacter sp. CY356]MCF0056387.1 outer membrane beta-barrel protein [Dyadobacter sp. CY356]
MKNLYTFVVYFLFTNLLYAQSQQKQFHFGILGGTQIIGKTFQYESLANIKGAVLGIDVSYAFKPERSRFSIHAQPNWSSYKRTNEDRGDTDIYQCQAINLPLLLRYSFTSGKIRPFAEAGVNVRYRTDFKVENRGNICELYGCFSGERIIDLQPEVTQNVIGLVAGAGIEFEIGKISIPITVRINEGIGTSQMKEMREDSYYYSDIKTRNIQITTGITF